MMDQRPQREACAAIQGMMQEHDTFLQGSPDPQILTMFDLGAAAKTEYYEIASYRGLIEKCRLMGQQQCAQLLERNLRQEQAMAQRVTQIGQELGQRVIGMTGQSTQAPQIDMGPQSAGGI